MSEQEQQENKPTDKEIDDSLRSASAARTPVTDPQPAGIQDPDLAQKGKDNMDPTKQADVPRTPVGAKNVGAGFETGEGKPGDEIDPVQRTAPMNPEHPGFNQSGQTQIREGLYQHPEHAGQPTMRDTGDASQYEVTRKIRLADEEAKARREGREPNPAAANAVRTSDSRSDGDDGSGRLSILDRNRDNLSDNDGLSSKNSNDAHVIASEQDNKDQQ